MMIILFANALFGQSVKIDSLKALLPVSQGVNKIDVLLELAFEYSDVDDKSALQFGIASFKQATAIGDSLRMVKAGRISARALRKLEKYDSAITIASYCEGIADRNNFVKKLHGSILNGLAVSYLYYSKYDQALSSLLKAMALHEADGDKPSMCPVLNNIGLTYYKLKDYRLASEYYEKCLNLMNSIGNDYDRETITTNISICYAHLGNLEEARKVLQPLIETCLSKCDDRVFVNTFYTSGIIWYKSDSLRKAETDFLNSYHAAQRMEDHRFVLDNIVYLSKIYLKLGELSNAERFLKVGEKMTRNTLLDLEEMKIYEELSALYKKKGDYRITSFYQAKYIQTNDSIYNESQTNNLMQLHAEVTEKEYKTQLASQEQMMNLKNEVINKQLGINILIGVALLLLSILVYVLVRIFQDRKQVNLLLTKKVMDRTNELERNHRDLMTAIDQRDKALSQWTSTLNTSVDSMRAVCSTAMSEELNPDGYKYFADIDGVTSKVSKSLDTILIVSN